MVSAQAVATRLSYMAPSQTARSSGVSELTFPDSLRSQQNSGVASGLSRHWLTAWSATRPRATLARMSSAVAVHTNGLGSLLCAAR